MRDILDQQLLDRNGRKMGRVDGIVLTLRADRPPKVTAFAIGIPTLARRVHPRLEPLAAWVAARLGADAVQLPVSSFKTAGVDVELDVDAGRDPKILRFEKWLSRTIVQKIPGGKRKK